MGGECDERRRMMRRGCCKKRQFFLDALCYIEMVV